MVYKKVFFCYNIPIRKFIRGISTQQMEKVEEILEKYDHFGPKEQAKFMKKFGGIGQKFIRTQCKKAHKKEKKTEKANGRNTTERKRDFREAEKTMAKCPNRTGIMPSGEKGTDTRRNTIYR